MFNLEEYEPVDARIAKWWEKYPSGSIQTEIYHMTETSFIFKATGYTEEGLIVATGFAQEVISSKGVNANFALENCESSSIGRMLANAGFQAKLGKRPSREEMAKVERVTVASENDPWVVTATFPAPLAETMEVLSRELGAQAVASAPNCKHGEMNYKEGISSKTGKPYSGYTCPSKDRKDQCDARWNKS